LNANVLFLQGFFESHPLYDQTQGIGAVFSWLYGYLYCKNTHNTREPWELRNMSRELYLLCVIEHTVYNNVILNVLVVSTFSANFPTHLTNFYFTPENYQPYLFYSLVYA
jgi:hypothetical protein